MFDIRGVAVAGVEGEPVTLTEPVTEAIAAAFAAWLLDKKKLDASRGLRVSIGHDSRISAQKLQALNGHYKGMHSLWRRVAPHHVSSFEMHRAPLHPHLTVAVCSKDSSGPESPGPKGPYVQY
ncbi:hypothetical protein CsSME_00028405 [Camellia sinensis var. sinensis]